jgi:peptide deformylase
MALRNILWFGDEILRKKSREVENIDARIITLLDDMNQTLQDVRGVGLAAPQVGILKRVVIIHIDDKIIELINPKIVEVSGSQEGIEGCLSYPGKYGITKRPQKVTITALNRKGKKITKTGEDLLARAFCHEIDHLNGKLFIDDVIRMLEEDEVNE